MGIIARLREGAGRPSAPAVARRGRWAAALRGFRRLVEFAMGDQHPDFDRIQHVVRTALGAETKNEYDYQTAAQDFQQHPWVHKALQIWGDALAGLPIGIKRADGTQDRQHELIDLLEHPSAGLTAGDLWREWALGMGMSGEVGWELLRTSKGKYGEIHSRAAVEFAVRPDDARKRYREVKAYVLDPDSRSPYVLPPDEFKHFKFFNPLNVWRGIGPMSALRLSILIDEFILSWSSIFFRNSARPDYALIVPQGLTSDERKDLEFQLSSKFSGEEGWHKPVVLEHGVQDIKVISHPRKDLEWLQQRRFSRDEIGGVFGIPDEIMGFGRNTYQNYDVSERILWSLTITNLVRFRDEQLTHFFHQVGALDRRERIWTDLGDVWILRRARAVQYDDALKLFELGVPFNVIDAKLGLGIGPVPGGDEPHPGLVKPIGAANPKHGLEGGQIAAELADLFELDGRDAPAGRNGH